MVDTSFVPDGRGRPPRLPAFAFTVSVTGGHGGPPLQRFRDFQGKKGNKKAPVGRTEAWEVSIDWFESKSVVAD
jgi:hypothetical protein